MKYSDDIFQLVKTLSKQEKSYFKKFASAFTEKESSNYLKLFDEIVKQASNENEYDESKIKSKNFSGKFLKNLSFHKNYLYNMLLTAMTLYHKDSKSTIALKSLISKAQILFDKLLFDQCNKVLQRAKRIAIENEFYIYQYEILNLERMVNKYTNTMKAFTEKSKSISSDQYKTLMILKNSVDYSHLNDSFVSLMQKKGTGFVRNKKELERVEKFFENELLKDENSAEAFQSKILFHNMKLQYYAIKNDYENAYLTTKKIVGLWEANLNKGSGRLDNYINSLNNLLTIQIRLRKFEEFEKTVAMIRAIEKKFPSRISEKNKVFIFYSLAVLTISKYFAATDDEGLEEHEKEIAKEIFKYENKISGHERIVLYYFLGVSNFIRENYEQCINWMNKIFNNESQDLAQDYQCHSRIVHLLSYYELGYFDSLEYALKSTYRFLSKRARVYKYENIILKYLRRSFLIASQKQLDEMFEEMKFEMEQIYDDPFEQSAFDAFNILFWLESKIKKVRLMEIMKNHRLIENKVT